MKAFEIKTNKTVDVEICTRRWAGDVEILEREIMRSVIVNDPAEASTAISVRHNAPRLVISNPMEETRSFISKARSELGEIDNFLRESLSRNADGKLQSLKYKPSEAQ